MQDKCEKCQELIAHGKCLCAPIVVECPVCLDVAELHCTHCLGDGCRKCNQGYVVCDYCHGFTRIKQNEPIELSGDQLRLQGLLSESILPDV